MMTQTSYEGRKAGKEGREGQEARTARKEDKDARKAGRKDSKQGRKGEGCTSTSNNPRKNWKGCPTMAMQHGEEGRKEG